MLDKPSPLYAAQSIIGLERLPADAEAQINALYAEADEMEKEMFADIYEGLFDRLDEQ